MKPTPQYPAQLVRLARAEIGTREIGTTNCSPRVNQYKAATNLPADQAWPWCAAFVCFIVAETILAVAQVITFKRPTTASAWDLENWSRAQDASTNTRHDPGSDILPGDIVIYTFHHTGIASQPPNGAGYFDAIEGNTDHTGSRDGGGVEEKTRHVSQVRSRIRFTV